MDNYEITIITPFHNIKKAVFASGVESMKAQTLGFEKIEWIIVFHNCSREAIDGAVELTDGFANVKTVELNNDIHTPASPRNYGLRMASAPYVGFLDGDDSYTPWCLETVLDHIKKSGAQITWFRREYQLENENTIPVTEKVLWNQTYEEIIIDRTDNWDDEKLFSGIWGMVTSRIYDAGFLRENNILFDEEIPFGEDYAFNIEAYGHVRRLCYLPRTIGYHYFINSDSLVQKNKKTPEMLIQIARGFVRMFDAGLKYGFYMDATMGGMLFMQMRFMMGTESLTLKDRIVIRGILEPYLNLMKPIRVSKLYSQKGVHERYHIVKDYLLNPEKWANGEDQDTLYPLLYIDKRNKVPGIDFLRDVLDQNSGTDVGERYHFNDIITVRGYQSMVPVMDDETLSSLVALTTRIGESGIFAADKVVCYIHTLMTGDEVKLFPVTEAHLKTYLELLKPVLDAHIVCMLFFSLDQSVVYNDHSAARSMYSAIMRRYMMSPDRKKGLWKVMIPEATDQNADPQTYYYLRIMLALANEKITLVVAPNTGSVVRMLDFAYKNRENICSDIEKGSISYYQNHKLSQRIPFLHANPARAAKLREVLESPWDGLLYRIWPCLKGVFARSDISFRYPSSLVMRAAPGISFQSLDIWPYAVRGMSFGDDSFLLDTDRAFYEGREYAHGSFAKKLVSVKDMKCGSVYRLHVTNQAGLYRYDTGQCIRILAFRGGRPVYENADYLFSVLRIGSLRLNSRDFETIVMQAVGSVREKDPDYPMILDFACGMEAGRLVFYMETPFNEHITAAWSDRFAHALNEAAVQVLCEAGADIMAKASTEMKIEEVEQETFFLFYELKALKYNVTTDDINPQRFLTDKKDQLYFHSRIRKRAGRKDTR